MKHKFLLLTILLLGTVSFLSAQTIADFEDGSTGSLTLHVMGNGDYDDDAYILPILLFPLLTIRMLRELTPALK